MPDSSAQSLGISYFGPVEGSSIIPPQVITFYFIIFFILLAAVYIYLHKRKKPVLIWHKIKFFVVVALALKVLFIGEGGLVASYWLLPTPQIQMTTPNKDAEGYATNKKIEIVINDPLVGQVYWQRAFFDKKWNSFGRSGVAVF